MLIVFILGCISLILGFYFFSKDKKNNWIETKGKVIDYTKEGNIPHCIVSFTVHNNEYQVQNEYESIKKVSLLMSNREFKGLEDNIFLDDDNVLHMLEGAHLDLDSFCQKQWPLQSNVTVYYNEQNPEKAFINYMHKPKSMAMIFIWIGVILIVGAECYHMIFKFL